MNQPEQHTSLRNILDLLVNSRQRYMDLCNRIKDLRAKDLLNVISWERIALETALMAEARRIGIMLADGTAATVGEGAAAWEDVCGAPSIAEGQHVLAACERGESYLLTRYDEVLQRGDLDVTMRNVLMRQRAQVQGNVNNVRSRAKRDDLALK